MSAQIRYLRTYDARDKVNVDRESNDVCVNQWNVDCMVIHECSARTAKFVQLI